MAHPARIRRRLEILNIGRHGAVEQNRGRAEFRNEMDPFAMFNRKLLDFLSDLRPLCGHLSDFNLLSSSAKWMSQFDEHKNQELFHQYLVVPHEERVLKRDDDFFMEGGDAAMENVGVVKLLKVMWKDDMQLEDRDAVWSHLGVLIVLSKRCELLKST